MLPPIAAKQNLHVDVVKNQSANYQFVLIGPIGGRYYSRSIPRSLYIFLNARGLLPPKILNPKCPRRTTVIFIFKL